MQTPGPPQCTCQLLMPTSQGIKQHHCRTHSAQRPAQLPSAVRFFSPGPFSEEMGWPGPEAPDYSGQRGSLKPCCGHLQSLRSSASWPAVGDAGESKSSTSHP